MFLHRAKIISCGWVATGLSVLLAACGVAPELTAVPALASPLDTPIVGQTAVAVATAIAAVPTTAPAAAPISTTQRATETAVVIAVPMTLTVEPTALDGAPNARLTSTSVIATITALAATPTYPPTDKPRARRVVIGAAGDAVPPTTAPDKTGITVQLQSQRVFAKGPATLTIKTKAGVACELSNIRESGGKEMLEPIVSGSTKVAGSDGVIAWIWTVDGDEPTGIMRLIVDCQSVGVKVITMNVNE